MLRQFLNLTSNNHGGTSTNHHHHRSPGRRSSRAANNRNYYAQIDDESGTATTGESHQALLPIDQESLYDYGHHNHHHPSSSSATTGSNPRQLGSHKPCCGSYCLHVGFQFCCVHATSTGNTGSERYCSYCEDRIRAERRNLRRLQQEQHVAENQRRRLVSFDSSAVPGRTRASSSDDDESSTCTPPRSNTTLACLPTATRGIQKPCCGRECNGLSYVQCCQHADTRPYTDDGLYRPSARSGDLGLVPRHQYYCQLCYDHCENTGNNSNSNSNSNNNSRPVQLATQPEQQQLAIQFAPAWAASTGTTPTVTSDAAAANALVPYRNDDDASDCAVRTDLKKLRNRRPSHSSTIVSTMTMTSSTLAETLERLPNPQLRQSLRKCWSCIECPVCLEPFQEDPCTLPCGHSVCLSHMEQVERCPICRYFLLPAERESLRPTLALRETALAMQQLMQTMLLATTTQSQQQQQHGDSRSRQSSREELGLIKSQGTSVGERPVHRRSLGEVPNDDDHGSGKHQHQRTHSEPIDVDEIWRPSPFSLTDNSQCKEPKQNIHRTRSEPVDLDDDISLTSSSSYTSADDSHNNNETNATHRRSNSEPVDLDDEVSLTSTHSTDSNNDDEAAVNPIVAEVVPPDETPADDPTPPKGPISVDC